MIKFALRRNLIYPFQYLLWSVIRDIESDLISIFFKLDHLIITTPLMFLGEFLGGLILYIYDMKIITKYKKGKDIDNFTDKFIKMKHKIDEGHKIKIIFVIFTIALYDFVQFFLAFPLSKFVNISASLEKRLRATYTIVTGIFCYYKLGLPIFKHHYFSLISIVICIILIISTEFGFQEFNIFLSYGQFSLALVLVFLIQLFHCLEQSFEKLLFVYYNSNPYYVLMIEGIFGLIFCVICSFFYNFFDDIIEFKKEKTTSEFVLLIFCLIIYVILSGGKNIFRLVTTKIFSPMTTTFVIYMFNPINLIISYFSKKDFKSHGESNLAYFLINFFISLILSFFGGVYNEFIILLCCGLERDTHNQVTKRSELESEMKVVFEKYDGEEKRESINSDYYIQVPDNKSIK